MGKTKKFDKIQEELLKRRHELKNLSASDAGEIDTSDVKDVVDQASFVIEQRLQNDINSVETDEIKLIDAALARIEKGEYGNCQDCGSAISDARLEYYPYAARCIVCQEAQEA